MSLMGLTVAISIMTAICGVLIKELKLYSLIAGYNTANQKEKKNIDVKYVAKVLGIGSYIYSGINLLLGIICNYYQLSVDTYALITSGLLMLGLNILIVMVNRPFKKKLIMFLLVVDLFVLGVFLFSIKSM